MLKGSYFFLQVTALAWIYVVSIAMRICCGITPVLYHMVTWVMLSGTVKSSAGWDQNDMNSLVIINVFCKTFHNSLYSNLSFMYFVLIHSHHLQLSFKKCGPEFFVVNFCWNLHELNFFPTQKVHLQKGRLQYFWTLNLRCFFILCYEHTFSQHTTQAGPRTCTEFSELISYVHNKSFTQLMCSKVLSVIH